MIERTRKGGLVVAALAALGLVAALGACRSDPIAVGAGKAVAIQTSRSLLNTKANTAFQLTGQLLDDRMTPLTTKLDVSSSNAGAVAVDSVVLSYAPVRTIAYMHAPTRTAADSSTVTWSGGGFTSTTKVVVTP